MMFVSAFVQFNSSTNTMSTNARLRWEYRPGSELFIVYNEERDTLTPDFRGEHGLPAHMTLDARLLERLDDGDIGIVLPVVALLELFVLQDRRSAALMKDDASGTSFALGTSRAGSTPGIGKV